jgi:hypothetical protein
MLAVRLEVISGVTAFTVRVNVSKAGPSVFPANKVILYTPISVGVPEMVSTVRVSPTGSGAAPKLVGEFVAVIVYV